MPDLEFRVLHVVNKLQSGPDSEGEFSKNLIPKKLKATTKNPWSFLILTNEAKNTYQLPETIWPLDMHFKLDLVTHSNSLSSTDMLTKHKTLIQIKWRSNMTRLFLENSDLPSIMRFCKNHSNLNAEYKDKKLAKRALTAVSPSSSDTQSEHQSLELRNVQSNPLIKEGNMLAAKEQWLQHQLRLREHEFTDFKAISVFIGTWNVNGKVVQDDISMWLLPEITKKSKSDIFVLGFQEVDMSAEAFLLNETPRVLHWNRLVSKCLHGYDCIATVGLVGILMLVYVKRAIKKHIKHVKTHSKGCGVMGMGNKGAVACRFHLYDSCICFVNSHLAAGKAMVDRRNSDFDEICSGILFADNNGAKCTMWDSDILVWLGDLNYRLSLEDDQIKSMLKTGVLNDVLEFDQLFLEKKEKRAFQQFNEAKITFPPTYKYDPGTDNFDTSEKKRSPAWCDRILFRNGDDISSTIYSSCMQLRPSDHKPVFSLSEIKAKVVNPSLLAQTRQKIIRELDRYENECIPDVKLSTHSLEFGKLLYGQPLIRDVIVENVGSVVAQFRFVPKVDQKDICQPWLSIEPVGAIILPGEKTKIRLSMLINYKTAPQANTTCPFMKLEDILILHLENGKDCFLTASGTYYPSSFGMNLSLLVRLPDPVRQMSLDGRLEKIVQKMADNKDPTKESLQAVPKEIWRLVDYLYKNGLDIENLFIEPGNKTMMEIIRECLDTGDEFPNSEDLLNSAEDCSVSSTSDKRSLARSNTSQSIYTSDEKKNLFAHSIAEVLIDFLEALPNPVIPFGSHYQNCIEAHHTYALAKQVVSELPSAHHNLFIYLNAFIRELLKYNKKSSELNAEKLAIIFSSVFLRTKRPASDKTSESIARKKTKFLLHFLVDV